MEKNIWPDTDELLSRMVAAPSYMKPELIRGKGLLNISSPFPLLIWQDLFFSYGIDSL